MPKRWCQTFITEDNALAERLATDPRVAFLSFIGSAKVGWYLHEQARRRARAARWSMAAPRPSIVDRSADLDTIIEPMVKGGYYHAGQVCVSTQRIFVHEDIAGCVHRSASPRGSQPCASAIRRLRETEVGPLIQPREADRVASWIEEAADGRRQADRRRADVRDDAAADRSLLEPAAEAKVSQLEVFGPVTCVYGYRDLDDAIAHRQFAAVAFQASVFSRRYRALRCARPNVSTHRP